jgi:hypothetical protein
VCSVPPQHFPRLIAKGRVGKTAQLGGVAESVLVEEEKKDER